MIFDKNLLETLNQKFGVRYPQFNINVFLLMLEVTSRFIGYQPSSSLKGHYMDFLTRVLCDDTGMRNSEELTRSLKGLYLIMVCFCYLLSTLEKQAIDFEFESIIVEAIENRFAVTMEEATAEKHLLFLLIRNPRELLQLIMAHSDSLEKEKFSELIERRILEKKDYYIKKELVLSPLFDETCKSTLDGVAYLKANKQREYYLNIISAYLQSQEGLLEESESSLTLTSILPVGDEVSSTQWSLNTSETINKKPCIESRSDLQNNSIFSRVKKVDEVPVSLWYRVFSGSR